MATTEILYSRLSSTVVTIAFAWPFIQQYLPDQLGHFFNTYTQKFLSLVYPYIQITFHEYSGDQFKERSELYSWIDTYLGCVASLSRAKRLIGESVKDSLQSVVLTMDDNVEVIDEFKGVKVWWSASKTVTNSQTIISLSSSPPSNEKRCYKLKFHQKHRNMITNEYINYVTKEGKAFATKHRRLKMYTNSKNDKWGDTDLKWSHVHFHHPASFETLAMEPNKKKDIINDLMTFRDSELYYAKIGKAWKRGYLLYGPPGTGKSTMIAAMAKFLEYDIYDLELTSVKDNTELRKLLIETTSKSILVIEDIDCSLDLTGQRQKTDKIENDNDGDDENDQDSLEKAIGLQFGMGRKTSEVTLSGLLNFVDGLWSGCAGERIIVFTTNYIEKLDPALIRRGRMDMHIELSYCRFDAFEVLAKNYLGVQEHELFGTIKEMLEETDITPADVAECLMPKCAADDVDACLERLVSAIEAAKEEGALKVNPEAKKINDLVFSF